MITDLFAYAIPGQDGCGSFDDARTQLRDAHEAGVERLVAVARFDIDAEPYKFFARRIRAGLDFIACRDFKYGPEDIRTAAVTVLRKELLDLEELSPLCVSGTNVLLLDMPEGKKSADLLELPLRLKEHGLRPVMLHGEIGGVGQYCFENGIPCCYTAGAFLSIFSRKKMMEAAAAGMVSAIGSEIKGVRQSYRDFKKARAALGAHIESIDEKTEELFR